MQKVNGFEMGCLLGTGGFGAVHAAKATRKAAQYGKGEEVAIKSFHCASQTTRMEVGGTARIEYEIMKKAASPYVIRALQFLKRGGSAVLDARRVLTVPEAKCVARCIGMAMEHLHSLRVIHRDIKPENVLLVTSEGGSLTPKLSDFGLAKRLHEGQPPTDFPGSPMYMAPEVQMMRSHDERCDIYSYGITVYELLVADFQAAPTEHVPPSLPDPRMEILVAACIRSSPDDRPTASKILESPVFYHHFIPARLLVLLEQAERRKRGAALRWRLEGVSKVGEITADAPRMLVASAMYERIFISQALCEFHIGHADFEVRLFEDRLSEFMESDGTIDLLFPVGDSLRIRLLNSDEPIQDQIDSASPPPPSATRRSASPIENRDDSPPPTALRSSEPVEDPVDSTPAPVMLAEPTVGPSQMLAEVGGEHQARCECGKSESFEKMCICTTCAEKDLPGALTDRTTPFSALRSHIRCAECSAAHLLRGHVCQDATDVEHRRKVALLDMRHLADKKELRKTIRALKRRLNEDEKASTSTASANIRRHVKKDILSRKESLATATKVQP